nr:hypothetical protein [Tanacetum cinerariifolium]
RNHGLKRLYKVRLSARVESSADEESLGEEDASKQERISNIDANQDIYLVNVHRDEDIFGVNDQDDISMFDADKDLQGEEAVFEKVVADKEVSAIEEVNAASITIPVSAAAAAAAAATTTAATTPTISMDKITLDKALIEIKTSRPKAKRIVMKEPSETSTPTPIVSSQQPLKLGSYKKRFMSKKYLKEKELDKMKKPTVHFIEIWEDIQAKVDADYQLAERLHAEEQEHLTDAEKAKLFMEFMEKRRKLFTAKRTAEKRNKPPTKAQQRSIMSTYLKNIDGWKTRALKNKSFADIQDLFNKAMKRRAGDELEQEIAKKKRIEDENESAELKRCLEIVLYDGDNVTINATPLSSKSLIIVDYKIYKEGRKSLF